MSKTEFIIIKLKRLARTIDCVTFWARWRTQSTCLRNIRRNIGCPVRISWRVRCVHPHKSGPKWSSNSSPRAPTRKAASHPPTLIMRCQIPLVRCPQSRHFIPVIKLNCAWPDLCADSFNYYDFDKCLMFHCLSVHESTYKMF